MTLRPHDALFKSAFEAPVGAAALLRELVPSAFRDAVAWDTLAGRPGSFVDLRGPDLHNDLLFSAELCAGEPGLVFFLLEHQSTPDPAMPQRMISYQARIWDRFRREHLRSQLPPVLPVLVSHVLGGWTAPRTFEELFDPGLMAIPELAALIPHCSMILLDLARLSNADLQARSLPPFQKAALWLLRDGRDSADLLRNFDDWAPLMREAGQDRAGLDALQVLIGYMWDVIDPKRGDELQAKLHTLGPVAEEAIMTIAEMLKEEGRVKGRAEGRSEGRIEAVRKLLLYKFQNLDAAFEARLQTATSEAIDRYLRRLLTADSLAAVFED